MNYNFTFYIGSTQLYPSFDELSCTLKKEGLRRVLSGENTLLFKGNGFDYLLNLKEDQVEVSCKIDESGSLLKTGVLHLQAGAEWNLDTKVCKLKFSFNSIYDIIKNRWELEHNVFSTTIPPVIFPATLRAKEGETVLYSITARYVYKIVEKLFKQIDSSYSFDSINSDNGFLEIRMGTVLNARELQVLPGTTTNVCNITLKSLMQTLKDIFEYDWYMDGNNIIVQRLPVYNKTINLTNINNVNYCLNSNTLSDDGSVISSETWKFAETPNSKTKLYYSEHGDNKEYSLGHVCNDTDFIVTDTTLLPECLIFATADNDGWMPRAYGLTNYTMFNDTLLLAYLSINRPYNKAISSEYQPFPYPLTKAKNTKLKEIKAPYISGILDETKVVCALTEYKKGANEIHKLTFIKDVGFITTGYLILDDVIFEFQTALTAVDTINNIMALSYTFVGWSLYSDTDSVYFLAVDNEEKTGTFECSLNNTTTFNKIQNYVEWYKVEVTEVNFKFNGDFVTYKLSV